DDQPSLRRVDEGLRRPTARQGGRRSAHPPRPHHRDRQPILALQARTRPQQTTSRHTSVSGPRRAPAPPLRLRLRSGTAARRPISYETKDRKPDGGWGHFKPPRWGRCKSSRRMAVRPKRPPPDVGVTAQLGLFDVLEAAPADSRGNRAWPTSLEEARARRETRRGRSALPRLLREARRGGADARRQPRLLQRAHPP